MKIIVNQPFGIGDVIFTQSLVRIIADGRPIIWPVMRQFVPQLQRAYPDIEFVPWGSIAVDHDRKKQYEITLPKYGLCTVLPLRFADSMMNVPYSECMRIKYTMYGIDWNVWKEDAMWERDQAKEDELISRLNAHDNFTLINRFFGSDSQFSAPIPHRGIEMCNIDGFSLFDWAGVLERATEIHTVSTSIIYILEMLNVKNPIHIYNRKPIENHLNNVAYLLDASNHNYHKHIL